ncbi:potassium/proton antiporter [Alkalimonas sp. MEB108]|uniref:Potassium/proton antiporter n=1 Tax=Alkalimonas cellulosilytica TaxID=3058395 RepID=A0ABU7J3J6_9GAMM|nr:potassium/proton antiporter [Alkalimonas sp. MEB108]MEE2000607.1 potassium/proton antiporter [Alkalimonas sp. MEB108]
MEAINLTILVIGALFLISIIATLISARLGAPILLVFLIIGMLAGEQGLLGITFNNPQVAFLIGSIALVIILFDGGMRTHPERFRVALAPAAMLATLGVVITCTVTGLAAAWILGLHWLQGLLLGAILSSTDAAAVFSIFQSRGIRIKDRVASTLEIESGSNDPMAVMLTVTLVGVLAEYTALDWSVLMVFLKQAIIGGAVGYGAGRLFVFLCRKLPLSFAFFPLMAVACCISVYAVTTQFEGSGFLAVYLMGYFVGNARLPQVLYILRVHDGLAWLSQIVMFLMLGLLVVPSQLLEHLLPALAIAGILIFIARPLAVLLSLIPFHFPAKDQLFISWVGLRGAVPIILALFPWLAGVPDEHLYFNVAFVIVIVSLVFQGWSISPVARWLKLEVPKESGPDQTMPLDAIDSNDVIEVISFNLKADSPMLDKQWQDFTVPHNAEFLGVIRNGEWLLSSEKPVFKLKDSVLVLCKMVDVPAISTVLASAASSRSMTASDFFGDFVLNGQITLDELDAFYSITLPEHESHVTLADYITERFHRRVVVGDQVKLDALVLTVRQLDDQGNVKQVGIKPGDS